ncbi:MAG TPA: CoA transferase [Methylomirabilota bacterium]|jgi:crotonobetainyl-CoA:carnitine CoA-transferase CaiB-like acyl-CoA transferase
MLDGIRVLDLSRVIAGPYCAMLLADLGADVVKVERPGRGDDMRYLGNGKDGMSLGFATINRNKRAIAVDLQHPEGLKIILELARRADVVIENFVPGVAERLGLGYAALRATNPAVVYASVSGYGQDGPYARRPGYNTIAMGMSGLMALTGQPGDPPTRPGGSISDVAASYIAFGAVCAGLVQRFRTGRGQHVDVSLLASSVALLPDPSAHYFASGVAPKRVGNRNPNVTPAEAFKAADGFINVVILNPEQYEKFCRALGDEGLVSEPRFATNDARIANHPDFKARVEAALARRTVDEWVERLIGVGLAAGPIYEFDQVFDDAQVKHTGMVREVDQPGLGTVRMLGFPFAVGGVRPAMRRPAPRLGQHTREVLAELGIGASEIDQLAALGAVATSD